MHPMQARFVELAKTGSRMKIQIQRIDKSFALVDAACVVRVRRIALPAFMEPSSATEVDFDDPLCPLRSNEPVDAILSRLRPAINMVELTGPDGDPVFVNAARVTCVAPCPRRLPGGAQTILIIGGIRQAVRQTQSQVAAKIEAATSKSVTSSKS